MADVRVEGPAVERGEEILTPGGAGVRRRPADPVRRPPRRAAGRPGHPPGRDRRRPPDRLPRRRRRTSATAPGRCRRPRPAWSTAGSRSPARPSRRWRSTRSTAARTSGWPTSRTPTPRTGATSSAGRSCCTTPSAGRCRSPARTARSTGCARTASCRRSCRARAAGTCPSGTCWSTASPAVGALVDAGLYLFHNAREQLDRGSGPYFYLPKMESHLEARLWDDVFDHAEQVLGLPAGHDPGHDADRDHPGGVRDGGDAATSSAPTPPALNAGRWDYLFSVIKVFRDAGPEFVLPDRGAVTMTAPMMRAYTEQLVAVCHRRGAHRDRRHGRGHPQPARRRGQRAGAGQGPRGQDPRGRRRLRRLLGRPPRPRADLPGGLRRRPRRPAQPARPAAAPTCSVDPGAAARRRRRAGRPHRWPGLRATSRWRSATWRPGWPATAPSASTT